MTTKLVELLPPEVTAFVNDGVRCLRNNCGGTPDWIGETPETGDVYCSRHAADFCVFFGLRPKGRLVVGDAVAARAVETARRHGAARMRPTRDFAATAGSE